jgi:hypothetical protein
MENQSRRLQSDLGNGGTHTPPNDVIISPDALIDAVNATLLLRHAIQFLIVTRAHYKIGL